jgi:Family of unknown function (DUF6307)
MAKTEFLTRYEQRIRFVQNTIQEHSKLGDKASRDLAVHVVHALDHIPETTR